MGKAADGAPMPDIELNQSDLLEYKKGERTPIGVAISRLHHSLNDLDKAFTQLQEKLAIVTGTRDEKGDRPWAPIRSGDSELVNDIDSERIRAIQIHQRMQHLIEALEV